MKINCKINFFFPKDFKPLSESTIVEIPLSINNTQLNQPHHFLHKQANNQWVTSPNFKVPHFLKLEQHKSQSNQPNTNFPLKLTVKKKEKKKTHTVKFQGLSGCAHRRSKSTPVGIYLQKFHKHPLAKSIKRSQLSANWVSISVQWTIPKPISYNNLYNRKTNFSQKGLFISLKLTKDAKKIMG